MSLIRMPLRLFIIILTCYHSNAFAPIHNLKSFPSSINIDRPRIRKESVTTYHMEPAIIATGGAVIAASAIIYFSGSEEREKRKKYSEWEEKDRLIREERARLAYVEPRECWKEEELKPYDGSDEDGPILMAVDGDVYNVWKGRHFYGPGCEYHIFAGRDATRLLAKSKLEEETEEEKSKKLNITDRASLQAWIYTFKTKYEIVGKLEGFDPSTTTTRTN